MSSPEAEQGHPPNVILVGVNEVAEQMLRLRNVDSVTIATTQSDEELTDDEVTAEVGDEGNEDEEKEETEDPNPTGRCYEEGEIESEDEYGEGGEIIRTLSVFQHKEGVVPDGDDEEEEEASHDEERTDDLVAKDPIKLKCLYNRRTSRCTECRRQFVDARSLAKHARIHSERAKTFFCRYCTNAYPSKEDYEEHLASHDREYFYMCHQCGKKFTGEDFLERHRPYHDGRYQCHRCNKRLLSKRDLRLHMGVHVQTGPGRRGRPRKVIPELVGPGQYLYQCDDCGKKYSTMAILKTHRLIHAEERYRCEDCDKAFTTMSYLKQHLRIHDKTRSYMCQYCGKTFVEPWYCKRHELTHTDAPALKCDFCGAGFSVITTYRRHLRTHTGEKPFVCTFCGKRFTEKGTLRRHERTHTGDKPYACKFCDKKFSVLHAMKRHMRTHDLEKGFPCKLCTRAYYDKGSLMRHEKHHKHTDKELRQELAPDQPVMEEDTLKIVEAETLEVTAIELLSGAKITGQLEDDQGGNEMTTVESDTIHLLSNVKHSMGGPVSEPLEMGGSGEPGYHQGGEVHHQHHMVHPVTTHVAAHAIPVSHTSSVEVDHTANQIMHGAFMGGQMLQQVQLQDGRSVFATVYEKGTPGNWQVHVHDTMTVNTNS